jgi:hypothetical protein
MLLREDRQAGMRREEEEEADNEEAARECTAV